MAKNNRLPQPGSTGQTTLMWIGVGAVLLFVLLTNLASRLSAAVHGTDLPSDPWAVAFGVVSGAIPWTITSTVTSVLTVVLLAAAAFLLLRWWRLRRQNQSRVDDASYKMGLGADAQGVSVDNARAFASRVGLPEALAPGITVGTMVAGGRPVMGTWEDTHCDIWGPRVGKTSSRAIPACMDAPGTLIATSNKRDIVDPTRLHRERRGQVWVFDPMQIAGEPATWWWDPLSFVTDEETAAELAGCFASADRGPQDRRDPYFDGRAESLLADLLLAASLDGSRFIQDVYIWLTRPGDQTSAEILDHHGYPLAAANVRSVLLSADKERSGVMNSALNYLSSLRSRRVLEWVQPTAGVRRPQLDVDALVANDRDTLYLLSREGVGTAGPFVTALTIAVTRSAERRAARSGGRLPVPLVVALDEAANICRWRDLPAQYSHFGSKGIIMLTFLQSWSQGQEVWGSHGMKMLWSSANIKVLGGGVDDLEFLKHVSEVVGEHDKRTKSVSYVRGRASTTHQLTREKTLPVDDLAALPKMRAVVMASGQRPTLVRTQPWWEGPHMHVIKSSLAKYGVKGVDHR